MATLVRNKIIITPNAYSTDDYEKQIKDVIEYCSCRENKYIKHMSFSKISPIPPHLKSETKEEDDWLLQNWGTRFKAINACWIADNEIIFDTFWNPAVPIFLKIAKNFNNTDFDFKFASKKTGTKAGEINVSCGEIILFNNYKPFSKEAYEISFELMPHLKMLYTFNQKKGTYEYDTSDFRMVIEQKGFYKEDDGTVLIGCDDKQNPLFNTIDDLPF